MKSKIKNYWIIVALVIIANIAIFTFFSKRLESVVVDYTLDGLEANSGL